MGEEKEKNKSDFGINLEEMTKAGLHFGHRTSRVHPKIKPYISTVRNTVPMQNHTFFK
jgi:small subunit ribosomal protein S2